MVGHSTTVHLNAQRRLKIGRQAVKPLRVAGLVPAVVYGRTTEALAIAVNQRELVKLLRAASGEQTLVTLRVADDPLTSRSARRADPPHGGGSRTAGSGDRWGDDGAPWETPAIVHAVQYHPVDGHVVHVDFHAIRLTERVKVKVAVVLKGEPVGVKQDGGILEQFLREVEVDCLPTQIPKHVEVEVGHLSIGQTVHVRDLLSQPDVRIINDPASAVASVQAPKVEKPAAEVAPVTEPEVIREKKEEPEGVAGEAEKAQERPKAPAKKEAKST